MNWIKVGHCPKCGAPIYQQSIWFGTGVPPITYTCNCHGNTRTFSDFATPEAKDSDEKKE